MESITIIIKPPPKRERERETEKKRGRVVLAREGMREKGVARL